MRAGAPSVALRARVWQTLVCAPAPHRDLMNLLLRINLALGTAFVLAALLLVYIGSRRLETNARRERLREAGLMMVSSVATFAYPSEQILPLLQGPLPSTFLPLSVPVPATTQNFLKLHTQHPEYS